MFISEVFQVQYLMQKSVRILRYFTQTCRVCFTLGMHFMYLQAVQINKQTPVAIWDFHVAWRPHEHYTNLYDTPSSVSVGST